MALIPPGVYRTTAYALGAVVLVSLCIWGVARVYDGIFEDGRTAGRLEERERYQQALLQAQDKQLALMQALSKKNAEFAALQAEFKALESTGPKEAARHVAADPAFAAARRPAELHAQRVRELRALQKAAAAH